MLLQFIKILIAIILSFMFTLSLTKLVLCFNNYLDKFNFDSWLDENDLGDYKFLFLDKGNCYINVYLPTYLLINFSVSPFHSYFHVSLKCGKL